MKKKTASLVFAIFLIGIASALVVPFLSNTVSGTIEVKGPVFYAGASNQLLINEFDGSSSTYTIDDVDSEKFFTMSFDSPIDFYKPKADLFIRARVSNGEIPKNLELVFMYFNSNGNVIEIRNNQNQLLSDNTTITIGLNDYIPAVYSNYFMQTPNNLPYTTAEAIISFLENSQTPVNYTLYTNFFQYQ